MLLAFEIVRANLSAAQQRRWPWNIELLGIPTTAALLATALVVLLARDQFARSQAPSLRYVSQWVTQTEGVTRAADRYRQVILRNAGPGTAVVLTVTWSVAAAGVGASDVRSLTQLREMLDSLDVIDGADYAVSNYSPGTALAPGEERLYFECTERMAAQFSAFEAVFEFESLLGDRYSRRVSLLPHPGASAVPVSPSAVRAA